MMHSSECMSKKKDALTSILFNFITDWLRLDEKERKTRLEGAWKIGNLKAILITLNMTTTSNYILIVLTIKINL